ncbi:MAG: hypothetical protein QXX12_05945 [Nanopusillaceae archaeon]
MNAQQTLIRKYVRDGLRIEMYRENDLYVLKAYINGNEITEIFGNRKSASKKFTYYVKRYTQ